MNLKEEKNDVIITSNENKYLVVNFKLMFITRKSELNGLTKRASFIL